MLTLPPSLCDVQPAGTRGHQPGSRALGAVKGCAGLKAQTGSPVTVGPGTPVLVKGRAQCAWLRVCTCLLQTREGLTENQAQWLKVGLRASAPAAASRHRPEGTQRPPALVQGPPPATCPALLTHLGQPGLRTRAHPAPLRYTRTHTHLLSHSPSRAHIHPRAPTHSHFQMPRPVPAPGSAAPVLRA